MSIWKNKKKPKKVSLETNDDVKKSKKRPMNEYQKFVKEETKKEKYNGLSARDRLIAISKEWQHLKI